MGFRFFVCDGAQYFVNHLHRLGILKDGILDSKSPDIVFYSVFGYEHIKYDALRIFVSGENLRADFNFCDYAIGFDYLSFGKRYLRYPLYLTYGVARELIDTESRQVELLQGEKMFNRKFCSFIFSNSRADSIRTDFFTKLSAYKKVDSGGRYKNNIGYFVGDKLDFCSKYKFNIAFENSSSHGYITEKIFEAKAANSVPIYWGDSKISVGLKDEGGGLNVKAFVNIHDFKNLDDAIEFIKYLDKDKDAYLAMLNEPLFLDKNHIEIFDVRLKEFLAQIIENPKESYARGFGQWRMNMEKRYTRIQRLKRALNPKKVFEDMITKLSSLKSRGGGSDL